MGAGSLLRNLGSSFLDLVPSFIREPFKQALGIRSPSRVFKGFGVNVIEGLAIGLEQLRPMHRAVEALNTAVVNGYTPPGAVGAARVSSDAPAAVDGRGAASSPGQAANITELGAATLQALAQIFGLTVTLDGSVIATNSGEHFARSTMLGAA